jgi:hypothetical protein
MPEPKYTTAVLADGRQLTFPKGTDPAVIQATVKKVMAGGKPPPAPAPADSRNPPLQTGVVAGGEELGVPTGTVKADPITSAVARPIYEGLAGLVTGMPDLAVNIANRLPAGKVSDTDILTGKPLDPNRWNQSPGDYIQSIINQMTTEPTSKLDKFGEFVNSLLVGGIAGPKMPRVPSAGPIARRLASEGVVTTPGQRAAEKSGQLPKLGVFLEEKAGAIHPSIGNARGRATEGWNRARLNQTLKSMGSKELPAQITNLREANQYVYQELQTRYAQAYSQATVSLKGGTPLQAALLKARSLYQAGAGGAGSPLGEGEVRQLKHIIDHEIIGQFTTAGKASGETIKNIENLLRTEAERLEGSEDYAKRKLADTLSELREAFKQTVLQQNPKAGAELNAIDQAYAEYKLSERSSLAAATKGGAYTPGQRLQAAKARDPSKDKGAFARGSARGQREAEEAQKVLGNKEPNSGTPAGMMLLSALGAGGAGLAAGGHLATGGLSTAAALAPMGIYSAPVLKWLQNRAVNADPELLSRLGIVGAGQQAPNPLGTSPTMETGIAQ